MFKGSQKSVDFHPYPLRSDIVGKLNLYEMVVMPQHHEATNFLKSHFDTLVLTLFFLTLHFLLRSLISSKW